MGDAKASLLYSYASPGGLRISGPGLPNATQQLPHVKFDARPILGSCHAATRLDLGDQGIVSTSSSHLAMESTHTYVYGYYIRILDITYYTFDMHIKLYW